MARRRKKPDVTQADIDLTPMIDVTFLLVMFFVLTSTFSPKLEEVQLPVALQVTTEPDPEEVKKGVLIINIRAKKDATREGEIVWDGVVMEPDELEDRLKHEVEVERARGRTGKYSELNVRVRADEALRGEYLRQVFQACAKAKIWKVKLSAEKAG